MFCILQCAIAIYDSAQRYISVIYNSFILGDLKTKTKLRSNLKEADKIFHKKLTSQSSTNRTSILKIELNA